MQKVFVLLLLFIAPGIVSAQGNWTWRELKSLPISTSNNAVSEAFIQGKKYVYSFGGITDSLNIANIHQKVFQYNVRTDVWTNVGLIPDSAGRIGSYASRVKDKIYLIGGKYIREDSTEIPSNRVHIYNPSTSLFEPDGANLPVPVSNHVQSVWKDSLIYVITGEGLTGTVPNVQIYNPSLNTWKSGTPVPNNNKFKSFGASGYILGDTIFYYGGAYKDSVVHPANFLRKGIIDPHHPTQINWKLIAFNFGTTIYHGACSGFGHTLFWVGGTSIPHNFRGLSYTDSSSVFPNQKVMEFNLNKTTQLNAYSSLNNVMDVRGIASLGGGNWVVVGGIGKARKATNKVFLLHNPVLSNLQKLNNPPFFEVVGFGSYFTIQTENVGVITIYDLGGNKLYQSQKGLADIQIKRQILPNGMLLFVYEDKINLPVTIKKLNIKH